MTALSHDLRFYLVDVFAERPLEGNPLAIVPDADGVDEQTMRRIAREFNQSETTFLVRPTRSADYGLRSFTPAGVEVFGAGHNALGALWLIAETRILNAENGRKRLHQQLGRQVLPFDIDFLDHRPTRISMEQAQPELGATFPDPSRIASALGAGSADVSSHLPAQVVSTGAAHLLVPIRSRNSVDRLSPDSQKLLSELRTVGAEGCYAFSIDGQKSESVAYARFFNPTAGIWEDAATGSAAGPLAFFLRAHNVIKTDGKYFVEQGYALGRPSRIGVSIASGRVSIEGRAAISAEGNLTLQ